MGGLTVGGIIRGVPGGLGQRWGLTRLEEGLRRALTRLGTHVGVLEGE